jgi:hypothetical protein
VSQENERKLGRFEAMNFQGPQDALQIAGRPGVNEHRPLAEEQVAVGDRAFNSD